MESQGGWIKLYWKTKQSIAYSNGRTFALWGYILLNVARKRTILLNGNVLEAGECIISQKDAADWLEVHHNTVAKYLNIFEQEGMIRVSKRDRNGTHLSVCNWSTYQTTERTENENLVSEPSLNRRQTVAEPSRNCPQTENPKSPKSPKKERDRPTTEEAQAYATERGYTWDVEAFIDHYEANGWVQGRGKPIKDWKAAMRNWNKRQPEFVGSAANGKPCHEGTMTAEEGYTYANRDGVYCFFSRQLNMWVSNDTGEPTKCQSYSIPAAPTDLPSMRASAETAADN